MNAALAGSGAAIGVSLASWPVIVAVANSAIVGSLRLGATAAELAWASPFGVLAGLTASAVAGLASQRAWPRTAFGSWLIWAAVLAVFLAMGFVPPLFAATAAALAFATTWLVAMRWRPSAVARAPSVLAGFGGFAVFVAAVLIVIFGGSLERPGGVSPEVWRRYMDRMDAFALASVAVAALATVALSALVVGRPTLGVFVSLLTFVALIVAATPMLGFLSACSIGETLLIFRWLVSPTC